MKTAIVTLKSVTPYSASRMHDTPKLDKERPDEYEARTWREKAHLDSDGIAYIPAIAFKMALDSAAKYLSISVPGKGKSTFTKHFLSGVLCAENLSLKVPREKLAPVIINANSDGVRGSGKRVKRTFPVVPSWDGKTTFFVFDDAIPKDVFERVLSESGKFIGVGQYRPQNGGTNGRFEVLKVEWEES
ncbi:MAG: hypothetical protein ACRCU5_07045 [Rhizobiaceae bacterium]